MKKSPLVTWDILGFTESWAAFVPSRGNINIMWDDYINHRIPQLQSYRTPKDPCQKNTSNFSHQSCTPPSQLKQCWWIQQTPKNWKTSLFFSRRGHLLESMVAHVSKSLYQTVSNKIDFQSLTIQFVQIEQLKNISLILSPKPSQTQTFASLHLWKGIIIS